MNNFLRTAAPRRLLAVCSATLLLGVGLTAAAEALTAGPTPPVKPLANAIRDSLKGGQPEGFSAQVQYTNRLFEGINLAEGQAGELASSPLVTGAGGRVWIARDGRMRLELQASNGDTELTLGRGLLTIYDVAARTVYRYKLPSSGRAPAGATPGGASGVTGGSGGATSAGGSQDGQAGGARPTLQAIEAALSRQRRSALLSGAQPTDVAGRPAYTLSVAPQETGSLIGSLQLTWDATYAVPLRGAIYSTQSTQPVIELAVTEVNYGPVADSEVEVTPPAGVKVVEVGGKGGSNPSGMAASGGGAHGAGDGTGGTGGSAAGGTGRPHLSHAGHGITSVLIAGFKPRGGHGAIALPAAATRGTTIGATKVKELVTELGTLLTYEQGGTEYLLVGAVKPANLEALVPAH